MNEDTLKHLEFIQSTIDRMARNSFALKGWSVTLCAALLALAAKESDALFAAVSFLPAISFWMLDAYYLQQERLFRNLYDYVRHSSDKDVSTEDRLSMSTERFREDVSNLFFIMWSPSVRWLHLMVVGAILVVLLIILVSSFESGC